MLSSETASSILQLSSQSKNELSMNCVVESNNNMIFILLLSTDQNWASIVSGIKCQFGYHTNS
jgi:hypothetical protein